MGIKPILTKADYKVALKETVGLASLTAGLLIRKLKNQLEKAKRG